MGFIDPAPPPFDVEEWRRKSHFERIKPLAQDWALNGFGTPYFVYLLYVAKVALYAVGGLLVISATTSHLGGLGSLGEWWTEPIVFQKAVVWTMLWEILGLGAGSLPLTLRFKPMIGGVLYWLRPGTTRLPPWPERVPGTRGTTRTWLDVGLYAGLLATALFLIVSPGEEATAKWLWTSDPFGLMTLIVTQVDVLRPVAVGVLLAFLAALGLRDKVPFLAARPEIYGTLAIIFLFPLTNMILAAQLVFFSIWWGAASSKLNRHFPFVVTVMISNTPWNRSRRAKAQLYTDHPENLLPSRIGAASAHLGTVVEFTLPLILILTQGGLLGTLALAGMVIFHVHIFSTFPLAVPLAILAVLCVGLPVLGNFRPDLVSFLPSMRYYAGNWATSQWLFRKDSGAEDK